MTYCNVRASAICASYTAELTVGGRYSNVNRTSYTAGLTVGGRYRVYVGYPIVPIESLVVCMLRCVFLWCVFCGVHVEVCMLWCTCCGVHVVVCML